MPENLRPFFVCRLQGQMDDHTWNTCCLREYLLLACTHALLVQTHVLLAQWSHLEHTLLA